MSAASHWYVACEFLGHRAASIWSILISQTTQCGSQRTFHLFRRESGDPDRGDPDVCSEQQRPCYTGALPHSLTSFPPNAPRHVYPQEHMCARSGNVHRPHTFCKSHVQLSRLRDLTCLAVSRLSL